MTDIEGKTCEIGAGSVIYITPGIAASHEWHVKEQLQILGIYATMEPLKTIQFKVDKSDNRSYIDFDRLMKVGGAEFKSIY